MNYSLRPEWGHTHSDASNPANTDTGKGKQMKKTILFSILCVLALAIIACTGNDASNNAELTSDNDTEAVSDEFDINDIICGPYVFARSDIPTEEELDKPYSEYDIEFLLTKKDNKIIVTDYVDTPLKTFNIGRSGRWGFLIAGDYGEFGNYVYYVSLYEMYEIDVWASDFYVLNDDYDTIYCVNRYWPLDGSNEGKITRITRVDGDWRKDEGFEIVIQNEIYSFCVEGDTVYIVTYTGLIKIKDNQVETVLLEDVFEWGWRSGWGYLNPNSSVKIGETLYIGMRGGIASYNLETGELLWYEQVADDENTTESTSEDVDYEKEYNKLEDEYNGNFRYDNDGEGIFAYNGYYNYLKMTKTPKADPSTFKNTTETEVTTAEKATELAKNELIEGYEYERIEVYYDKSSDVWGVLFLPAEGRVFDGGQHVFIDGRGMTRLITYFD